MFGFAAIGALPTISSGQETVEVSAPTDESPVPVPTLETPDASQPEASKLETSKPEEKAKEPAAADSISEPEKEPSAAKPAQDGSPDKSTDSETEDLEKKETEKKAKDKAAKSEPAEPKRLPRLGVSTGPLLPGQKWRVHDIRRPRPAAVTPGELSTYDKPGTAPSDAIVLFDGKDLSQWCHVDREDPSQLIEAQWKVEDGFFEVTAGKRNLQTIDSFGSCQLHIEWQTPAKVRGDSQGRGNSGVFFMDAFEVQVLDSFDNRTYADGQAGALYGQYSPMVNASRKPGEWQIYDIIFEAPKFSLDEKLEEPASITVMHNGIFLHHAKKYYGPTGGGVIPKYNPLSPAGPIRLQEHGNPVRFRNIWIRPLNQPQE